MHSPHLELARKFWSDFLRPGDLAIDATCGQGRDTLFLCQMGCTVYGLDIQKEAIEKTRLLIEQEGLSKRLQLHHTSHATFPPLPSTPRLIVYNLGYLPGGNKELTTQTETTTKSVKKALELVGDEGAVSIVCYPGHPEGEREEKALLEMMGQLPSDQWLLSHTRWLNRIRSPSLLWIKASGRLPRRPKNSQEECEA